MKSKMDDIEEIGKYIKKHGKQAARAKYTNKNVQHLLKKKSVRSWSGVLVITVVTRPDKFSCPFDCHYCPNEPGQPRSYLSTEPAVARANQNDFDAIKQFRSRMTMLRRNGHTLNKIEIIVLGGTFSTYPREYQNEFIRDLFYAANSFESDERDKLEIVEEQKLNETAKIRIIGISLETRPDMITIHELMRFRTLGCTRVQLGVQHIDNDILLYINRGHTIETSIKAIKLLREYGFKIDLHVMPDLPGTTPQKDKHMLKTILTHPDFQPDYLKIYPCLDVEHTAIRSWKETGKWKPYSEDIDFGLNILLDVCMHAKIHSRYYTRFNRIQRDFPEEREGVVGYSSHNIRSNFRQILQNTCKKHGITCKCIRCCEVKSKSMDSYFVHKDIYNASNGTEIFISCASLDRSILYGFVRLRISDDSFQKAALIRELHVYGFLAEPGTEVNNICSQHKGIGKMLMRIAESYAILYGKKQIYVISGVGVREYYRKIGYIYTPNGHYMMKNITFVSYFWFIYSAVYALKRTIHYIINYVK